MSKKHLKYGAIESNAKESPSQINKFVQKLPASKRETLYQELKSSGSIDNPAKYTETHLKGGIEGDI